MDERGSVPGRSVEGWVEEGGLTVGRESVSMAGGGVGFRGESESESDKESDSGR